jgi:hypothetical protein
MHNHPNFTKLTGHKVRKGASGSENEVICGFILLNEFFHETYGIISLTFSFFDFVACQILSNLDMHLIQEKRAIAYIIGYFLKLD